MDKNIKCECGEDSFWYFGEYVRCRSCFNEYKHTTTKEIKELWLRRFDKENSRFGNWEHYSPQ